MKTATTGIASTAGYYRNYVESLSRQNRQLFASPLVWQFDARDLPLEPSRLFPNARSIFLEIGFGHGEVLEELVQKQPDTGFVGIERRPPRVNKALKRLHRTGCTNVRLIRANLDLISEPLFAPESFDEILINHPDPWPKRKHEHHRFFRPARMDWLASILKSGGAIEVASDQTAYFFEILRLFEEDRRFSSLLPPPFYTATPLPDRPMSRFEKRCRSQGLMVRILRFRKI
jgi:tRNA (guanine-N7-)-methyltransferase